MRAQVPEASEEQVPPPCSWGALRRAGQQTNTGHSLAFPDAVGRDTGQAGGGCPVRPSDLEKCDDAFKYFPFRSGNSLRERNRQKKSCRQTACGGAAPTRLLSDGRFMADPARLRHARWLSRARTSLGSAQASSGHRMINAEKPQKLRPEAQRDKHIGGGHVALWDRAKTCGPGFGTHPRAGCQLPTVSLSEGATH